MALALPQPRRTTTGQYLMSSQEGQGKAAGPVHQAASPPKAAVPARARRGNRAGGSADLVIMRAWIEAELVHPGDQAAAITAVETAVMQAQHGLSRRLLGKLYYRLPEAIRPLLGRPEQAGLKRLLGRFVKYDREESDQLHHATLEGRQINPETGWIQGDAKLTERETTAYWLRIRGRTTLDIQRELTPSQDRYDRARWIAVQTVYNLCSQARRKVLLAFGLPDRGDPDELEDGA